MSIDAYGSRRGAQSTSPDCSSIVFIGDSVPFGWSVPDRASMPSKLFEYLQKAKDPRCVINAAIPAYSLFQAVARFERETGKFKSDTVYLQIYDPVFGFVHFGAQWRPEIDWSTEPATSSIPYVASAAIVENALRHFGLMKSFRYDDYFYEKPVALDQPSLDRFRLEIRKELEHLHDILVQANVKRLIVAPVTVPSNDYLGLAEEYRIAIEALNDEFRKFAERHHDTTFLDTIGLLKSYPDQDVFVDHCCHLNERGNEIVAEQIFEILQK
jgi:hypothetical protein